MKKTLIIAAVIGLVLPLSSSAHTVCEAGDLFNINTGAPCFPTPCQPGDIYDSQTGKLCSSETTTIPVTSTTPTQPTVGSVAPIQPVTPTVITATDVSSPMDGECSLGAISFNSDVKISSIDVSFTSINTVKPVLYIMNGNLLADLYTNNGDMNFNMANTPISSRVATRFILRDEKYSTSSTAQLIVNSITLSDGSKVTGLPITFVSRSPVCSQ